MKFESIYILDPNTKDVKAINDKVSALINKNGKLTNLEDWGIRLLAYPIRKHNKAYYVLINYKSEIKFIDELNKFFNSEDAILKHITIKKED